MTDTGKTPYFLSERAQKLVRKRYAAERRFRFYGLAMIILALAFLAVLFYTIISQGISGFVVTNIRLPVTFTAEALGVEPGATAEDLKGVSGFKYTKLARRSLNDYLGIPKGDTEDERLSRGLLSNGVDVQLRKILVNDPTLLGSTVEVWLLAHGSVDPFVKGQISRDLPENRRLINDQQMAWLEKLEHDGRVDLRFNSNLFTEGASADPELAGVGVALLGSFFMMVLVVLLALPLGVGAALYLEEFAPKNRFTDLVEVNINNLAAVPSIVFGILGLAVFINYAHLPRSAPIVGGLVLTLMTLPTVIIATRAAIRAVPPSIKEAALGVGASKMQAVFHHVLPLAMPGILTGLIIGLAQAMGETAPLIMVGMVAAVFDFPGSPMDPATALPVQIYIWSGLPERGFVALTSAAIMILLAFLLTMNATAVILRKRFERRW
ncbi:MAG: phosphate ABC transporter permease PstA [Alphaproteobacteria bacterium]|nr:phosphate ABC transporter permease PstA [Alphaproteobacteria bacterium]